MHTLPDGFHRIRHYGLLANGHRADEKLKLDDLHKATRVVALALADLLGA